MIRPKAVAHFSIGVSDLEASTPQEFAAFVRSEHDKWGKLIRDAKLNIEQ